MSLVIGLGGESAYEFREPVRDIFTRLPIAIKRPVISRLVAIADSHSTDWDLIPFDDNCKPRVAFSNYKGGITIAAIIRSVCNVANETALLTSNEPRIDPVNRINEGQRAPAAAVLELCARHPAVFMVWNRHGKKLEKSDKEELKTLGASELMEWNLQFKPRCAVGCSDDAVQLENAFTQAGYSVKLTQECRASKNC